MALRWGQCRDGFTCVVVALATVALGGCAPDARPATTVALLEAQFPRQADRVLDSATPLVRAPDGRGFVAAPPRGADPVAAATTALTHRRGLRAVFPPTTDGAVRLSLPGGFAVEVREAGRSAPGRVERGAVVYVHGDGAASFWSATDAGYEEWLLARAGADGAVASWQVTGARLRPRGDAVEVVDARGVAHLTVTAPAAYGPGGVRVAARLHVTGPRLVLAVAGVTAGALVLVDPAWQVTGALGTPRRNHTATLLANGKVLVVGGRDGSDNYLASAELYDPEVGTFAPTNGGLATARANHTATLLRSGKALVVGGIALNGTLASAEVFDPEDGTFAPAGGVLATGRQLHTATLLPSGKVLVVGGQSAGGPVATAELYEPATDAFTPTAGAPATARLNHTATLLSGGKVLVAGGRGGGAVFATGEVYDSGSDSFTPTTGLLTAARANHTATRLAGGRVLLAGGLGGAGPIASAEIYDPQAGTFAATTGALATMRSDHTATLLPSGTVLLAGGSDATGYLATAELYDHLSQTFTATATSLATGRASHTATLLPSGRVLVAGGENAAGAPAAAELYDPSDGAFAATSGALAGARSAHTATLLATGQVLVAGGTNATAPVATAELYDPALGTFAASTGPLVTPRYRHAATLLVSGQVLVVGGCSVQNCSALPTTAELFDPVAGTFAATTGPLATARSLLTATLLASGTVFVAGGTNGSTALDAAEVFDPDAGTFATVQALPTARRGHTATLLLSGRVLLAGGASASGGYLSSADLFEPSTANYSDTSGMGTARAGHTATLLPTGQVLLAGGHISTTTLRSAELYDPTSQSFLPTGDMTAARTNHSAALLPSGEVLITGGSDNGTYPVAAELYDPTTGLFTATGSLAVGRDAHTATLLPSGQVLVAGGDDGAALATAEVFDEGRGAKPAWTPTVTGPLSPVMPGTSLSLAGTGFTGVSESASGTTQGSATNYPIVLVMRLGNEALVTASSRAWTATSATATIPTAGILAGPHLLWVAANGALSSGVPLTIDAAPNGNPCTVGHQCLSVRCADGVCCDTACGATCWSCRVAGAEGTCTEIPVGREDHNPAGACIAPYACNGAGDCKLANGGACNFDSQCASGFCVNHMCCDSACDQLCQVCGASGVCGLCTADTYCDGTHCAPKLALTEQCTAPNQCQSDYCADQVCCATACDGDCEQCNLVGHVGNCFPVENGTDPKVKCQAAQGGHPDCAGKCYARQCAFPDVGTTCGQCSACDGTGRCTATPADDDTCGTVACDGLDTACRSYQNLTASRCAALGACKAENDPATCTEWTDLPCTDGGAPLDGGSPGADAGGGGGGGGCGCAAAPRAGSLTLALLGLVVVAARRRR